MTASSRLPPLTPKDAAHPSLTLGREAEAERILRSYVGTRTDGGTDAYTALPEIMAMLERQFHVLHNRAQVLLALAGVVITTTGFSGRLIAGTNTLAQWLIIAGVFLVLLSAAVVVWGVLHLRWLTMQVGQDTPTWLATTLAYRDRKTAAYRRGIVLLLIGLTLYVSAIAVMLLNPHADVMPAR